jgi:hypothetical protein
MKAKEVKFLASNLDQASATGFDWAFKLNNAADVVTKLLKACELPAAYSVKTKLFFFASASAIALRIGFAGYVVCTENLIGLIS